MDFVFIQRLVAGFLFAFIATCVVFFLFFFFVCLNVIEPQLLPYHFWRYCSMCVFCFYLSIYFFLLPCSVATCQVMLLYCSSVEKPGFKPVKQIEMQSNQAEKWNLKRNHSSLFVFFSFVLLSFSTVPIPPEQMWICGEKPLAFLLPSFLLITALCLVPSVEGLLWPIRPPSHRQMNGEMTAGKGGGGGDKNK